MCGKLNPPDQEQCQYCEARLKPLVGPASMDNDKPYLTPEPAETAGVEEDSGSGEDWLDELRQDELAGTDELNLTGELSPDMLPDEFKKSEPPPAEEADVMPPWLSKLRGRQEAESTASEPAEPADEAAAPDWVSQMEDDDEL